MPRLTNGSSFLILFFLYAPLAQATPVRHLHSLERSDDVQPSPTSGDREIVIYRHGSGATIEAAARRANGRMFERLPELKAIVTGPLSNLKAGAADIAKVQPDISLHDADANCTVVLGCAIPTDSDFKLQWYLEYDTQTAAPSGGGEIGDDIDLARGWALDEGSSNVKIAIVDTGIDSNQPDLTSRITGDWSTPEDEGNSSDLSGHGTAVAGIAAANSDNGIGITGVAPNSSILNIKVTTAKHPDSETCSDLASGITAAVQDGAQVINVSSGSSVPCVLEKEAVDYAWAQGSLVVAAAGNYGSTEPFYPAAYEHVISVGSTDAYDRPASFSDGGSTNRGASWVDLAAPGVGIFTTLPTYPNSFGQENYGYVDGTSFSAPMVSGAAALLFSEGLDNSEVETRLFDRANPIAGTGVDWKYGMLDVCAAITNSASSCPESTPSPRIPTSQPPTIVVKVIYSSSYGESSVEKTPAMSQRSAISPTAGSSLPKLAPSTYRGETSQHVPIMVRVGSNGTIQAMNFSYEKDCGARDVSSLAQAGNVAKTGMTSPVYKNGAWSFRAEAVGPVRQSFEVLGHFSGSLVSGSVVPSLAGLLHCEPKIRWSARR
jgi:thermitase